MKILFMTCVYPDENGFMGGIFSHNQALALKNAGHDVGVMFMDFRSLRKKRKLFKSKYQIDGIKVYRMAFPCGPIEMIIGAMTKVIAVSLYNYAIESFGRPEFIYAHFGETGISACEIKKRYNVPYVIIEHDSGILTGSVSKKQLLRRKEGYDNANAVLAVSDALKKELQRYTVKEVEVIPNIVPDYMFSEKKIASNWNNEYTFISVGTLIKSKSFDITIKGFAKVNTIFPRTKLIIVGNGKEEDSLKLLAKKLHVSEQVEFLGQVENKKLVDLLRISNCFVLPSKFETFGVVYIEAMACGLPVIATRCGGPEEFVNDDNGILITIDDVDGLVDAMCEMIRTGSIKYNKEKIVKYVKDKYSTSHVIEELVHVFTDVAINSRKNE